MVAKIMGGVSLSLAIYVIVLMAQVSNAEATIAEQNLSITTLETNQVELLSTIDSARNALKDKENQHKRVLSQVDLLRKKNAASERKLGESIKSLAEIAKNEGENRDWIEQEIPSDIVDALRSGLLQPASETTSTLSESN